MLLETLTGKAEEHAGKVAEITHGSSIRISISGSALPALLWIQSVFTSIPCLFWNQCRGFFFFSFPHLIRVHETSITQSWTRVKQIQLESGSVPYYLTHSIFLLVLVVFCFVFKKSHCKLKTLLRASEKYHEGNHSKRDIKISSSLQEQLWTEFVEIVS